ncbi:unnamed protein product [Nesidiocoris tenuis]|uniref:Uncharacterized protein n=1 Tax=Nesidiocoris tenuis TaxID=355587 RepID=A0A6H5HS40_9HEMI|nr:unnamed protein product [Nesidiocoris tenuis]
MSAASGEIRYLHLMRILHRSPTSLRRFDCLEEAQIGLQAMDFDVMLTPGPMTETAILGSTLGEHAMASLLDNLRHVNPQEKNDLVRCMSRMHGCATGSGSNFLRRSLLRLAERGPFQKAIPRLRNDNCLIVYGPESVFDQGLQYFHFIPEKKVIVVVQNHLMCNIIARKNSSGCNMAVSDEQLNGHGRPERLDNRISNGWWFEPLVGVFAKPGEWRSMW